MVSQRRGQKPDQSGTLMTAEPVEPHAPRSLAGTTVLQVAPALRDDVSGRAVFDLAIALLRAGARALVASGGGGLVGELHAFGGEWVEFDHPGGSFRRRKSVRALAELMRSERVALVHAHGASAARLALAARRSAPAVVLTSYVGAPPARGWRRPPQDAQARGDLVLACSHFAADLIAERHRIAREHIAVVPHSVDTDWFDPRAVQAERIAVMRETWRIRPEARIVLAPGRLIPSQGQLALVDAARSLVNGGLRGVAFVIAADRAADPNYVAELDARIAAQGLAPLVRRVGHCADMAAAYAAADLVVLPISRTPLFSATVAEAQAAGTPIVASDIGAIPELMLAPAAGEPGPRTGWLIDPDDPLDLARGLAMALALDRASLRAVGAQARHFAAQNFSPEQVTAATLSVYGWLLQPPT